MRVAPLIPLTVLLAAPRIADAQAPRPELKLTYRNLTAGRVNPLGLLNAFDLHLQHLMYRSDNPLFANNYVSLGVRPMVTPAWGKVAGVFTVQPLSVLQLFAEYEVGGYFGSFGLMQSFPDPNADYSDTRLDELEEAGTNYSTTGTQINVGAKVQLKVGPIAARSTARFMRPDMDLRDGDEFFYDIILDILLPNRAWGYTQDTDLLYVTDFGLTAGVRHTVTDAFYERDEEGADGEEQPFADNGPMHRLGPFLAYTFFDDPGFVSFDRPTAVLIVNWWLTHRFRTGEDVSQAIPYVVFAFAFQGDLWQSGY